MGYRNFGGFDILDSIKIWVRVIDIDKNVLFVNKRMIEELHEFDANDEMVRKLMDNIVDDVFEIDRAFSDEKNNKVYLNLDENIFCVENEILKIENSSEIFVVETLRDVTNERKYRHEIDNKNKRFLEDINFAKNMQNRMLPDKGMYNGLFINYIYHPSESLGGDVFDVYKIDSKNTGIYIADVAGHGVTASFLTMFVRQSIRTISKNKSNLNRIMGELLRAFLTLNLDTDKYFSIFFGIYNHETKLFKYVNAGQNTIPILKRKDEIIELKATGYPMCNFFSDVNYETYEIKLETEDRLIFYTDGIVEARNKCEEVFGDDKLIEIIKESDDLINTMSDKMSKFCGEQSNDDYSMLEITVIE